MHSSIKKKLMNKLLLTEVSNLSPSHVDYSLSLSAGGSKVQNNTKPILLADRISEEYSMKQEEAAILLKADINEHENLLPPSQF